MNVYVKDGTKKTPFLYFSIFLFQPKLSEPAIATNHNKQALLSFWYNVCVECPENVRLVVQNPVVTKNIAFNYILADHDDQEVVLFNRGMLPAYYGILRLCCEQSPAFTRQLASHQNIQWAFKNLTPHASQYPGVGGGSTHWPHFDFYIGFGIQLGFYSFYVLRTFMSHKENYFK